AHWRPAATLSLGGLARVVRFQPWNPALTGGAKGNAGHRRNEQSPAAWGFRLQRLFFAFPSGLRGAVLLLLRTAFAMSLLVQSGVCGNKVVAALMTLAGLLLVIGLLTPVVGICAGLGALLIPACLSLLYDSWITLLFSLAMLLAIVILGPG